MTECNENVERVNELPELPESMEERITRATVLKYCVLDE